LAEVSGVGSGMDMSVDQSRNNERTFEINTVRLSPRKLFGVDFTDKAAFQNEVLIGVNSSAFNINNMGIFKNCNHCSFSCQKTSKRQKPDWFSVRLLFIGLAYFSDQPTRLRKRFSFGKGVNSAFFAAP